MPQLRSIIAAPVLDEAPKGDLSFSRDHRVDERKLPQILDAHLLLAVPGFGPVRATHALARCQIPYGKTAAGLSRHQRDTLIALLRTEKPATIGGQP